MNVEIDLEICFFDSNFDESLCLWLFKYYKNF